MQYTVCVINPDINYIFVTYLALSQIYITNILQYIQLVDD